jgi:hypothetical protein
MISPASACADMESIDSIRARTGVLPVNPAAARAVLQLPASRGKPGNQRRGPCCGWQRAREVVQDAAPVACRRRMTMTARRLLDGLDSETEETTVSRLVLKALISRWRSSPCGRPNFAHEDVGSSSCRCARAGSGLAVAIGLST